MFKKSLALTFFALLSLPVYAMPDINARLTQTKLHQGSLIKNISIANFPFTYTKPPLNKALTATQDYTGGAVFSVEVPLQDDPIKLGVDTDLVSLDHVYIENLSKKTRHYTINYLFCADISDANNCNWVTDTLQLLPSDYIEYTKKITLTYQFTKPNPTKGISTVTLTADNGKTLYGASADIILYPKQG